MEKVPCRSEHAGCQDDAKEPLDPEIEKPPDRGTRASTPVDGLAALGLLGSLDRASAESMEHQLEARLEEAISGGRLEAGLRLPSTREAAAALGVSRTVVAGAYSGLTASGLLVSRHGAGTFVGVADGPALLARPRPGPNARWVVDAATVAARRDGHGMIDLRARGGSFAPLPAPVWRRAWRFAISDLPNDYDDARGNRVLREAIAGFVFRNRGVACGPDDILVTAGASDALALIVRALVLPGTAVALEDPGYQSIARFAESRQAAIHWLPVDERGVQVDRLPQGDEAPLLVHVTPSHQFPLGATLDHDRAEWLLAWAEREGSLIVENDYAGEFDRSRAARPSLASLDRSGVVALVGTFSRLLSPALRIGYVVAPQPLVDRLAQLKSELDDYPSSPAQRAVAQLIVDGELDRHLHRVRRLADHKRQHLSRHYAELFAGRAMPLTSGLHAVLELPEGHSAQTIVTAAAERGVLVDTAAPYYRMQPPREQLLIDYSSASTESLDRALGVLAELIAAAPGG